jgi:hypothetical protein
MLIFFNLRITEQLQSGTNRNELPFSLEKKINSKCNLKEMVVRFINFVFLGFFVLVYFKILSA